MKALIITTDNKTEVREIDETQIREIVGGYIEFLPLYQNSHLYINEEAKIRKLDTNFLASNVWLYLINMDNRMPLPGDYIAGTAVLLDSNGPEEADVTPVMITIVDSIKSKMKEIEDETGSNQILFSLDS